MAATNSVNFTSSRRSVGSDELRTPVRSTLKRPATGTPLTAAGSATLTSATPSLVTSINQRNVLPTRP